MLKKLREKLKKTRSVFKDRIEDVVQSGKDRDGILDDLTETLILADVGVSTTEKIIQVLRQESKKKSTDQNIKDLLMGELTKILNQPEKGNSRPASESIVMFVGVNGGGKTTSLAKVAYDLKTKGNEVLMVAADTFRAAAQEQLTIWGKRINCPVIKGQYGTDPAAVVFDAIQSYKAREYNVILIDTAGRIHTNINLMNELEKICRVISQEIPGAPPEVLLVLDASIGQNAINQAREFIKFSGLTGIFLTKLDGTARGGSVIGIADELNLPIKYIGIGESEKDMLPFTAKDFIEALLT